MRKIAYYLFVLFFVVSFSACEKVDYVNMNITQHEEEIDVKEFVGDLKSHIVITDSKGRNINNIDIGIPFYVIDNTSGGADSRQWEITQGGETITSDQQFVRLSFGTPGEVKIKLTSVRSSDSKNVSSESTMQINNVPVTAQFITDPAEQGGTINIYAGFDVSFTTTVEGSPSKFEWVLTGPVTLTSSEQNPTFKFTEAGVYDLKFTATRETDGDQVVIEKSAYINAEVLVVQMIRAVGTDNTIELQFTVPMAQDITKDAMSEFSIEINTAGGETLTPDVLAIAATGDSSITLTFGDKMYSDDVMKLTFAPGGLITDGTGLFMPDAFSNEVCVYGHNLVSESDTENQSKWAKSTNTTDTDGSFYFVDENSAEFPQKPYQGKSCIAIYRGTDKIGVSFLDGFTVAEGDVFEIAYEALTTVSMNGALERRFSLVSGDGGNQANGNWMKAGDNGSGTGEWTTIKKTINVSADTKGQVGELFLNFFRYGGDNTTDAIWVDNIRFYHPNPRP